MSENGSSGKFGAGSLFVIWQLTLTAVAALLALILQWQYADLRVVSTTLVNHEKYAAENYVKREDFREALREIRMRDDAAVAKMDAILNLLYNHSIQNIKDEHKRGQ